MIRAQIQHPMNWILILFAGAFFLLLFIAITRTVLDSGESSLEATTLHAVTTIIEKTKVNPGTRVNTTFPKLTTGCEGGTFELRSGKQQRTFTTHTLFAPSELQGKTTMWSEEFKIANPITTLTYFFPHDTFYLINTSVPYTVANKFSSFANIRTDVTDTSLDFHKYPHVVVIATYDLRTLTIPLERNQEAHGISFNGTDITFYNYTDQFIFDGVQKKINIDFLLGAIAAVTREAYKCGLAVTETQIKFLAKLNHERVTRLKATQSSTACQAEYDSAIAAYADINSAGLSSNYITNRVLQRASRTLGDNGCPDI